MLLPLYFLLDGALRLADRAYGVVTTRLALAVSVKTPDFEEVVRLVQPENYNKFLGELWDVSGLHLSRGPDAVTDFLAGWKVSSLKTLSTGLQTHLGCESNGTSNKHEIATRNWPGSDQAYCHAKSDKIKRSQNGRQLLSTRQLEGMQFSTDLGSSGRRREAQEGRGQKRSTETLGTSQPSKSVNPNSTPTATDPGEIVQTPARASAGTPTMEGDIGELIPHAVAAAMAPVDCKQRSSR